MDRATEDVLAAAVEYEAADGYDDSDSEATPPRRRRHVSSKTGAAVSTEELATEVGFDDVDDDDEYEAKEEGSSDTATPDEDESSDTADEDVGDPEATRETMKLAASATSGAKTVELMMPGEVHPMTIKTAQVLYSGDTISVKPVDAVKEMVPGQLAHIQLADVFVHAMAIATRSGGVRYRALSYAEEQNVMRNGLRDAFPKKTDYAALEKEQLRWDRMSDSDTLTAAVSSTWAGFFRTHKLLGKDRKRAFILSTLYIK